MPNPFRELAAAAVTALGNATPDPIGAVRTRSHRFSPEVFGTLFGDNPAVVISKGSLERSLSDQSRDSRRAYMTLTVTILDVEGRCDPTATDTQDAFDDFVNSVEKVLGANLNTATFGTAWFVSSSETDDIDATRGLGDFETTLELTYILESTEV